MHKLKYQYEKWNLSKNVQYWRLSLFLLIGSYLYSNILMVCPYNSQDECLNLFINPGLKYWLVYLFTSCILFSVLICFYLQKKAIYQLVLTLSVLYFL